MKFKTLFIALLCSIAVTVQSQNYNFVVSTSDYTNLTDATSLNNGLTWDDSYIHNSNWV